MKSTIDELLRIVEAYAEKVSGLSDEEFSRKPLPEKWSKKEVLGHLIDSSQNNLRRFITGQYESVPPKITYEQDFWVTANNYQEMKKEDVILLWKLMNQRVARVLANMPRENYSRTADTGKEKIQLHTLSWLADDYVKHMKHHLNQIFPGSFDVVYK
jgi:hypothetical protein